MTVKSPKKLIEVALPLMTINTASVRESYIYRGNPSALHKWWAQRPLAAARAVIFAQMVNDPGYERSLGRGVNKNEAARERERLFDIIRKLVVWENTTNEEVLEEAREEIRRSWRETCHLNRDHPQAATMFDPERLPAFHDPFAGGGSLPLEAHRLGLESYAGDLNPVAVLINKAILQFPPRFAASPPVNPVARCERPLVVRSWRGAQGLAEDVRYYGQWMRGEADKRIGQLYPKINITAEMVRDLGNPRPDLKPLVGRELTVIAWLWARTVKSPNPAFTNVEVPLASTFMLSTKAGKEVYVEPLIEGATYRFAVKMGKPKNAEAAKRGTKLSRGANFQCLMSGTPIASDHIYGEANAGRMGARLMAIVVEGERGRVYLAPTQEMESIALTARPTWKPDVAMPENPRWFSPPLYGLKTYGDLFTHRQLVALTTFADLVQEARERVRRDAVTAGLPDDGKPFDAGSVGAAAYADAVATLMAFSVDKTAEYGCTIVPWYAKEDRPKGLFARQAIPMVWDYAEVNPLAGIGGTFSASVDIVAGALAGCSRSSAYAEAVQSDAATQGPALRTGLLVSTDPPYYDNIGYADLSDFFYVWLRRSLKPVFPDLFATLAVPKAEELVATPYRHGGKEKAEAFFLEGMTQAMHRLAEDAHPAFPVTIYYAFKQSENDDESGTSSTGWDTFLEAVMRAGFAVTGTWPMRTERGTRSIGIDTNALASSIVLVCRRREVTAPSVSRREFIRELNAVLPEALDEMTRGAEHSPVAPVDLSQAIIGPGMAVFSKYTSVLEADGTPMSVRTALQLINRFFSEDDFDPDTRFCLHWFEEHAWGEGKFGEADVLARAKGTSVEGVVQAGVVASGRGSVRLLRPTEYPADWSPERDQRTPIWEAMHHLLRALRSGGEMAAGSLVARMPARMEPIRQLAYRLYTLCERKGWAEDARACNELITTWPAIESASHRAGQVGTQTELPGVERKGTDS